MKRQISFFLIIGASGFFVDALLTQILVSIANIDPYIARIPAILFAVMITYGLNKSFTFQAKKQCHKKTFPMYVATTIAAQSFNYTLYVVLINNIDILRLYPFIAVAFGSIFAAAVTFLLSKYWVFNNHA